MIGFSFSAPARTIFGRGSRFETAAEVGKLGSRMLVVRGRSVSWVDELVAALKADMDAIDCIYSHGEPTLEDVTRGVAAARNLAAEVIVAVGGGATVDLGKAISGLVHSPGDAEQYLELGNSPVRKLNDPLPFVALPTTAGTGAEATRNAVIGVPERQLKISLRDPRLIPDLAIVDPALTDGAPKGLTLATGLDAITQLVESYLCNRSTPVTDALCRATIPQAVDALGTLMEREDRDARNTMAKASYLSGLALANSGLGVVHGIASVIGARGGAHGAICGRLLAGALVVNRKIAARLGASVARFDEVENWLADGLGGSNGDGFNALSLFIDSHGLPKLTELDLPEDDFDAVAKQSLVASSTKANPIALKANEIAEILAQSG